MAARMVNAIPTANTNRAGFVATVPLHCKQSRPLGRIVRAESGEMCEPLHTSPVVQKMMGCSTYRSDRSRHWVKSKNQAAPAVKREAEEDWGKNRGRPAR